MNYGTLLQELIDLVDKCNLNYHSIWWFKDNILVRQSTNNICLN